MGGVKLTWLGRAAGYAVLVVMVAAAARLVWELLRPLLPTVAGVLFALAALYWLFSWRRM
ncbi:hypothetical protein GCM10023321_37730 [Pseudonocardia eucalypti]|uniref:Transmembrane protein n=1 Tax=Pseudonocardia eucalypti TaxID=648755 RepID=A0ABP9Q840_9PSEU